MIGAWLCRRGWHAWDIAAWYERRASGRWRIAQHRVCVRAGCDVEVLK